MQNYYYACASLSSTPQSRLVHWDTLISVETFWKVSLSCHAWFHEFRKPVHLRATSERERKKKREERKNEKGSQSRLCLNPGAEGGEGGLGGLLIEALIGPTHDSMGVKNKHQMTHSSSAWTSSCAVAWNICPALIRGPLDDRKTIWGWIEAIWT